MKPFRCQKGIALFEVLVAAVILAAGIIVVYQPLMASITGLYDSEYRLAANRVLTQQLWGIQENADMMGRFPVDYPTGTVTAGDKTFYFTYGRKVISEDQKLYEIEGVLSWKSGVRSNRIQRTVYARTI